MIQLNEPENHMTLITVLFWVFCIFTIVCVEATVIIWFIFCEDYSLNVINILFLVIKVLFGIVVSVGYPYMAWCSFKQEFQSIHLNSDGISIKYPYEDIIMYKWDEFVDICIIYAFVGTRGAVYDGDVTYIAFVRKGETKNRNDRWRAENPFHYRGVFIIRYSEANLNLIKEYCPYDISDLRYTKTYQALRHRYIYIKN